MKDEGLLNMLLLREEIEDINNVINVNNHNLENKENTHHMPPNLKLDELAILKSYVVNYLAKNPKAKVCRYIYIYRR